MDQSPDGLREVSSCMHTNRGDTRISEEALHGSLPAGPRSSWSRPALHFVLPPGTRHLGWMIVLVALFWLLFIAAGHLTSYYAVEELNFFKKASFWQIFSVMEFGDTYKRFSPLGFGLIGWLDTHIYVPLLGLSDASAEQLAVARRLVWFHPLFVAGSCLITACVTWRIFKDQRLVAIAVLLVGLSDTVPFQMRFVSTFVCYALQISALLAIYYVARLEEDRSLRTVIKLALCVAAALSVWEQGLDLAFAVSIALMVSILLKRRRFAEISKLPEALALAVVLAMTGIYLAIRLQAGIAEALTTNKEASYFLSYGTLLPMADDLLLNFSALTLQAFRQFLPFPPLSFSVMSGIDMNGLNAYNASYAQFPNMFYRMMGMWYSGVTFTLTMAVLLYALFLARARQGFERQLIVASVCVFIFGLVMHLPIMHRDYFYIPGFALGFKISISYMGFVMLIVLMAREFLTSKVFSALSARRKSLLWSGFATYFCCAAVSRAVLGQLPNRFPW